MHDDAGGEGRFFEEAPLAVKIRSLTKVWTSLRKVLFRWHENKKQETYFLQEKKSVLCHLKKRRNTDT